MRLASSAALVARAEQEARRRIVTCDNDPLPPPLSEPQKMCDSSEAQVVIFGGQLGGGKTWSLVREAAKGKENALHRGVLFRRKSTQARKAGSIWDETLRLYKPFGTSPREDLMRHTFPSGATVEIAHLQHEKHRFDWDGSQVNFFGFDQLEQFPESSFFYVALTRTRSMSGLPIKVLGTCNPVPEEDPVGGWLARLIQWWWDPKTGYPIAERSGVVRWMFRHPETDEVIWAATREEGKARAEELGLDLNPISLTFIRSKTEDNEIMLQLNPDYQSRIAMQPKAERKRLSGNWLATTGGGAYFDKANFLWLRLDPADDPNREGKVYAFSCRAWDLGGSRNGDKTASVLMSKLAHTDQYVIRDASECRERPGVVKRLIADTMIQDGPSVAISLPVDGGQSGNAQILEWTEYLRERAAKAGMPCPMIEARKIGSRSKKARAWPLILAHTPTSVGADGEVEIYGSVSAVLSKAVKRAVGELHYFDDTDSCADDYTDAAGDAYTLIQEMTVANVHGRKRMRAWH